MPPFNTWSGPNRADPNPSSRGQQLLEEHVLPVVGDMVLGEIPAMMFRILEDGIQKTQPPNDSQERKEIMIAANAVWGHYKAGRCRNASIDSNSPVCV